MSAYKWVSLSSMAGHAAANETKDLYEKSLTPDQLARAEEAVRSWRSVPCDVALHGDLVAGYGSGAAGPDATEAIEETEEATVADHDEVLGGPEIRRLFSGLEDIAYPTDPASEVPGHTWSLDFSADGSWEGTSNNGNTGDGFGRWKAVDDKFCVTVKDHYGMRNVPPLEACLEIYVNQFRGVIAGRFPPPMDKRLVLREFAHGAIKRSQQSPGSDERVALGLSPRPTN